MRARADRFRPLKVSWVLLFQRAREVFFDDYGSPEARIAAIQGYKEEGYSPERAGLAMGLVGYEELYDEEA